jgi:hypothetical protein
LENLESSLKSLKIVTRQKKTQKFDRLVTKNFRAMKYETHNYLNLIYPLNIKNWSLNMLTPTKIVAIVMAGALKYTHK